MFQWMTCACSEFFDHVGCETPFRNPNMPMDKLAEDSKLTRHLGAMINKHRIATIAAVFAVITQVAAARIRGSTFKKGRNILLPQYSLQNVRHKCRRTARFVNAVVLVDLYNAAHKNAIS
uniref:Uncharacterized protein n=1 Tax=Rhipicephalus zambeziensis TaxID=60191 RepID=A0A224YLF1_9ACAR